MPVVRFWSILVVHSEISDYLYGAGVVCLRYMFLPLQQSIVFGKSKT